jgi:hypothetical protein
MADRVAISHRDVTVPVRRTRVVLRCRGTGRCAGTLKLDATSRSLRVRRADHETRVKFDLAGGVSSALYPAVPVRSRDQLRRRGRSVGRVTVRFTDGSSASRLITMIR